MIGGLINNGVMTAPTFLKRDGGGGGAGQAHREEPKTSEKNALSFPAQCERGNGLELMWLPGGGQDRDGEKVIAGRTLTNC